MIDGQEDIILFASSENDAVVQLDIAYKRYQDWGLQRSPKLVFFGQPQNLTGNFSVYFDDLKYNFPNARRAVDVVIKLSGVLGLKYPKPCKLVWMFISRYIYQQNIKERYVSIDKLETYLNACNDVE